MWVFCTRSSWATRTSWVKSLNPEPIPNPYMEQFETNFIQIGAIWKYYLCTKVRWPLTNCTVGNTHWGVVLFKDISCFRARPGRYKNVWTNVYAGINRRLMLCITKGQIIRWDNVINHHLFNINKRKNIHTKTKWDLFRFLYKSFHFPGVCSGTIYFLMLRQSNTFLGLSLSRKRSVPVIWQGTPSHH